MLRTNAGLFSRAIVSDQDLPEARRAHAGWSFDTEHTAFDAAATSNGSQQLELEWSLLEELPHGHIGVARQLDQANRVRARALLTRSAPALRLLAPSNALWNAAARSPQPWLIALAGRTVQLWKRARAAAAFCQNPDMLLHRASDSPSSGQVINHAARAPAPVDDTARSA